MSNSRHDYSGQQNGRGQRLMSKVNGGAISLTRLEELLGKSTTVEDPPPPVFKKGVK